MIWRKQLIVFVLLAMVLGVTSANPVEYGKDIDGADVGILVNIDTIRVKDFVEGEWPVYEPTGQFFFLIYVDGSLVGQVPSIPAELEIDVEYAVNWSLTVNVPDDRHTTVRLELYAKNASGANELLDINGQNNSKNPAGYYLEIEYYLGNIGRVLTGRSDGSDDGNRGLQDDKDAVVDYTITTVHINNPPTISITYPTNGTTLNGPVTVRGNANDDDAVHKVEVKIDDGTWETAEGTMEWQYLWDTTQVDDGSHTVHARSYDGCNYSAVATVYIIVDSQQPALVITLGTSNIAPFKENTNRTIPITIFCYGLSVKNVSLQILEDKNLTITAASPNMDLIPGDEKTYLLGIAVPSLNEKVMAGSHEIIVRAVGNGGVLSNEEYITIVIHKGGDSTPGFELIFIIFAIATILLIKRIRLK